MNPTEWLEEIDTVRKKREKEFRETGKKVIEIYEGEKTPYNILYSNTEILLPSLFSMVPRPVIQPRFDDSPIFNMASKAAQRMLEYLLDTDLDEYEPFETAVSDAVLDALLPGRGVTSIKYHAQIEETTEVNDQGEDEVTENVTYETCCTESRKWDRVYIGYAIKWSQVPWIAYEDYLDEKECKRLFGDKATNLTYREGEEKDDEEENEDKGKKKTALVYQIWDKETRKVRYVSPQYKEDFLRVDDDPLGFSGFFNCPKPLQFTKKPSDMEPIALYTLYENQAKELNKIQRRLNKVVDAIKVRGAYDGALGSEIEEILKGEDNDLIPTDKAATLAAEGGLDKAIWLLPIQELMAVAQQLYQARESCKQVIYEITGISDILRGQSKASETLGAQKIKEAWGSVRIKRPQKEVQKYTLNIMKMMLEVAASKFSIDSWQKMTGLNYPTLEQKQKAVQQLQQIQQQFQSQQIYAQQTGQQIQPPQIDPQLQQIAQSPAWEEIIKLLKEDFVRSCTINIETNSTLDAAASEDKQLIGEFMNAFAQFMNGIMPLVQNGSMPFDAMKTMMLAVVRRYQFGREIEDQLKDMKPPQVQNPQLQQQAKQLQQEKQQLDQQSQKLQQDQNQLKLDKQQQDFEKRLAEMEIKNKQELAAAKQRIAQEQMQSDIESLLQKNELKMQKMFDRQVARIEKANARLST